MNAHLPPVQQENNVGNITKDKDNPTHATDRSSPADHQRNDGKYTGEKDHQYIKIAEHLKG